MVVDNGPYPRVVRGGEGEDGEEGVDERVLDGGPGFPQDGGTLEPGRRRVWVGFIIPAFVYWMFDVVHARCAVIHGEDN